MRTGILTLPLHTNYGGILQAYALQTALGRLGHDAAVIDIRQKPLRLPLWRMPVKYGRRILRNLAGHPYPILFERKYNRERLAVRRYTDKFIARHIHLRSYDGYEDIAPSDFDAIVVGSDQVWRRNYFPDIRTAYLGFAEGWELRRMAYAASFGTDVWEYSKSETADCARLLHGFSAVSVREAAGVDLCRRHLGVEAQHVLDPTMLLKPADYERLLDGARTQPSGGSLMVYMLDDSQAKADVVAAVAAAGGLLPFRINSRVEDINAPLEERIQPPVEQWLRGFVDAGFVVTDSFHACVFSILFNKPFIAVGNKSRGLSRFTSLLGMFGLGDRLICGAAGQDAELLLSKEIDWKDVNSRLDAYVRQSETFLKRL